MFIKVFRGWMYIFCIILNILLYHTVLSEEVQVYLDSSIKIDTTVSVIEGNQLELSCTSNDKGATFKWVKIEDPSIIIINPKLSIQSIQRIHTGQYRCKVQLSSGKETVKTVEINVLYPPAKPTIGGPFKVLKETTFTLTCSVDSNPEASVWWTYDDNPSAELVARGPSVTIQKIESSDLWLHCHAENTMLPTTGDSLSALTMEGRRVVAQKEVYIWQLGGEYTFEIGSTLDVVCHAEGSPYPDFSWTKENDDSFHRDGERLLEENVQPEFAGVYICNAENILEPTLGPEKLSTAQKRTLIKIVDPTIPEVCRNMSCLYRDSTPAQDTVSCPAPVTACNTNKGPIAAAVVGWIVAAIAVAIIIVLCLRMRRGTIDSRKEELPPNFQTTPSAPVAPRDSEFANGTQRPELPKRPVFEKQKSEHVYLDLHPYNENSRPDNNREDSRKAYDYVLPTDETDVTQNKPRTPSDGYEKPSVATNKDKHLYERVNSDDVQRQAYDNTPQASPDTDKSQAPYFPSVNSHPVPQEPHTKRLDSYEHPDAHI